ncbi:MAG: hypothetical protein ABSA63_02615 [Thermoplasmata archaeon]|jgi:hypothetical protein
MTQLQNPPSHTAARSEKTLDAKTVEVLALAVFRTLFRDGVHVPLKVDGLMDMDLTVKDNNVLLNLNQVQANVPELSIWRITFAYRGKPVVEYGRGIKNDMKVHFPQLCFLMLAAWREKRKKNQARASGDLALERELVTMSVTEPNTGTKGEAAG